MIELHNDSLDFSFPEVDAGAWLRVRLRRTLRIPDDGRNYPLPPGLERFPLRHVDDFAARLPDEWVRHGGVMLPMYQSEALWLEFRSSWYPFAVKVATGKINAVTGERWREGLHRDPQDYLVVPPQPWLDGYCAENGSVRQFVAMPLGAGYTAEEQITGEAEQGGLQIIVFPIKREVLKRIVAEYMESLKESGAYHGDGDDEDWDLASFFTVCGADPSSAMGIGAGGRIKQQIYKDPHKLEDWDLDVSSRCFVHIANSLVWRAITGSEPPMVPLTSEEYTRAGLPWFSYYAEEQTAVDGSRTLMRMKSVFQLGLEKGDVPLPENQSVETNHVIGLTEKPSPLRVREGRF